MAEILTNIQDIEQKEKELKQVKIDDGEWVIYYIDEATSEKWIKEYPNSFSQGGGVPTLKKIEKFPWE